MGADPVAEALVLADALGRAEAVLMVVPVVLAVAGFLVACWVLARDLWR